MKDLKPDVKKFVLLETRMVGSLNKDQLFAWPDPQQPLYAVSGECEQCGGFIGTLADPIRVWWRGNPRLADFYAPLPIDLLFVSNKVKLAVEREGLAGFIFKPIECVANEPREYQAFAPEEINGHVWRLAKSLVLGVTASSPIQARVLCDKCGDLQYVRNEDGPIRIDFSRWGGEDIFWLEGMSTSKPCLSSRFMEVADREKFTHFSTLPLAGVPFGVPPTFPPPDAKEYFERLRRLRKFARESSEPNLIP